MEKFTVRKMRKGQPQFEEWMYAIDPINPNTKVRRDYRPMKEIARELLELTSRPIELLAYQEARTVEIDPTTTPPTLTQYGRVTDDELGELAQLIVSS